VMRCPTLRLLSRSGKPIISIMGALCGLGLLVLGKLPNPAAALSQPADQSSLWVFAVGVSHYRNNMIDLQFADNDAQTLAAALDERGKGLFKEIKIKVLVNDQVTRQSILEGMKSFFAEAKADDTGVIALMGHGVIFNDVSYFLPYPADSTNLNAEGLPLSDFEAAVRSVSRKLRKVVLMLDTCHADAFSPRARGLNHSRPSHKAARGISLVNEVSDKVPDTFVLGSSQGDESSWEDASYRLPDEKVGHGAFTYALLRGLEGEAPAYGGKFYVEELSAYVSHKTIEVTHGRQTPTLNSTHGANFPIARAVEPPSPADAQQAAALAKEGEQARQSGQLALAKTALTRAAKLDPKNQVASVLNDEVSSDMNYRNSPDEQHDIVMAAAKLLKSSGYKGPGDSWAPRPMVVAFLDFVTVGGEPEHAGLHDALVARISQSLQGTKRVHVVDRHLIAAVLQEQKLSMTDLSNPATRLRVGQILVSRLIGTGDVASIGKEKYSVDLQMIDTETTELKVNLSESLDGSGRILAVADKSASDILDQLERDYPLKGKIVSVEGDRIVINLGSSAGATIGMRVNAVVEKPITADGQVIATELVKVGSIEITEVQENGSFAKALDHTSALSKGTKVIEVARPAAAAPPAGKPAPAGAAPTR
jgi:uncharacterized caspase-like protein